MKCPACGAPSLIIATRMPRRRRKCFNGHRFSTEEIVVVTKRGGDRRSADFRGKQHADIGRA